MIRKWLSAIAENPVLRERIEELKKDLAHEKRERTKLFNQLKAEIDSNRNREDYLMKAGGPQRKLLYPRNEEPDIPADDKDTPIWVDYANDEQHYEELVKMRATDLAREYDRSAIKYDFADLCQMIRLNPMEYLVD